MEGWLYNLFMIIEISMTAGASWSLQRARWQLLWVPISPSVTGATSTIPRRSFTICKAAITTPLPAGSSPLTSFYPPARGLSDTIHLHIV